MRCPFRSLQVIENEGKVNTAFWPFRDPLESACEALAVSRRDVGIARRSVEIWWRVYSASGLSSTHRSQGASCEEFVEGDAGGVGEHIGGAEITVWNLRLG